MVGCAVVAGSKAGVAVSECDSWEGCRAEPRSELDLELMFIDEGCLLAQSPTGVEDDRDSERGGEPSWGICLGGGWQIG